MSKHTPGPWHTEHRTTPGQFVTDTLILSGDGSVLAKAGPCNTEANAALIAAAPDLLEACRSYMRQVGVGHDGVCVCVGCQIRAAIAKAEGRK